MPPPAMAWMQSAVEELGVIVVNPVGNGGNAIAASPADAEQVAEVLRFATKHQLKIRMVGGGTKQQWGRGAEPQIDLSLARLNCVVEHPWQDLTCTVQAGCTWSKLQSVLAEHGQFVALDPLFPERATVGGILATNDCGSLRQKYGRLRDLVIGMTLVLADGSIVKAGGKVVKNVAGYDLPKLLTGSLGTLAVITEASFRLHPLPQYVETFSVTAPCASDASSLLAKIHASHLLTQSLQISCLARQVQLNISLNAHPEANQAAILKDMVRREGLTIAEASEAVWIARESLFARDATVLRAATLPSQVCLFVDDLQKMALENEISSVSDAVGSHWIAIRGAAEEVTDTIRKLRIRSDYPELTVSVLQLGPKVDVPVFEIPRPTLQVMMAIKNQFDPDHLLNPGKYSGI